MNKVGSKIVTRKAILEDAGQLREILNDIIKIGGTTAIEAPLTQDEFVDYFLRGRNHICCFVAVDEEGNLAGFQSMERRDNLPEDWADIATFARLKKKIPGVGTALFAVSRHYAGQVGIVAINATIRADNLGGLSYYEKQGFHTYAIKDDAPLKEGTKVDRISKQFLVE